MAQSPVIHALRDKRARLAGEIAALERRTNQVRADLVHVDVTLRLFGADPDGIAPISPAPRRSPHFPNGGIRQTCLSAFRIAGGKPLSAHDIAEGVMRGMGLSMDDLALRNDFVRRVQWALAGLRRNGLAVPQGGYRSVVWTLAGSVPVVETEHDLNRSG